VYGILIGIVLIKILRDCAVISVSAGYVRNDFVICYFGDHSEYEYFLPLFILSRFKSLLLQISSQRLQSFTSWVYWG